MTPTISIVRVARIPTVSRSTIHHSSSISSSSSLNSSNSTSLIYPRSRPISTTSAERLRLQSLLPISRSPNPSHSAITSSATPLSPIMPALRPLNIDPIVHRSVGLGEAHPRSSLESIRCVRPHLPPVVITLARLPISTASYLPHHSHRQW